MIKIRVKKSEQVSFYTHFAGIFAAIPGIAILLCQAQSLPHMITALIYGSCVIFLFSASSLYHAHKQQENENSLWRRLDHLAIFFMIAGTYTPVCYTYLEGAWRWSIIGVQWGLVLFGLFFKFFFLHAPRMIGTIIYLLMGWIAIIPIRQLLQAFPVEATWYLFIGAGCYTLGGIIYAIKKPTFIPGFFGFHEIFHIMILAGTFFHYLLIYTAVV